ncbi:hypothetical protein [Anaerococcus sp.]|uniref:DUF6903 family protein n=1 Tax=Anaerococcus sp. TaxID=1872515 RepID=UPI0027BA4077|nr:hypothetical protein [Anaerococcus sp.]
MDYYKKRKIDNLVLLILFVVGVVLQFLGHRKAGYGPLFIQFLSLAILLLVLYLYNRRHA